MESKVYLLNLFSHHIMPFPGSHNINPDRRRERGQGPGEERKEQDLIRTEDKSLGGAGGEGGILYYNKEKVYH